MSTFSVSVILEGQSRPSPSPVRLVAGPLTLLLEPVSGFIRQICANETIVWNGVYVALRDENWETVHPEIRDLKIQQDPKSFVVTFKAVCINDDIHFVWDGHITGTERGKITYRISGEAMTDFRRNRIGFCVLHDASAAGTPCTIDHVDGSVTNGVFPELISPHQPFKLIRSITHQLPNGITARSTLEGDVFEMEDQRNWTDASFKTYSTPIELPWPVELLPGDRIEQQVTLEILTGDPRREDRPSANGVSLCLLERAPHRLPRIGFQAPTHNVPESDVALQRLRALQPDHLRVDVRLFEQGWPSQLESAADVARQLNTRLHIAVFVDDHFEPTLHSLASRPELELGDVFLLFNSTGEPASRNAQIALRQIADRFNARLFTGSDAYFTEVNRARPDLQQADGLTWSINPQVHAIDNLTLLETLDVQWSTATTAAGFSTGELMISPVTLKPRWNPYASSDSPPVPIDQLPPDVDPRQMSLFGAAWTLGSIASLSRAELLRSVTYYETTGWRGLMETAAGPALAHLFVSRPDMVFPVYFVFALLAGRGFVRPVCLSHPLSATALLCSRAPDSTEARLIIASFVQREMEMTLPAGFTPSQRWVLDKTNAVNAGRRPEEHLDQHWETVTGETITIGPFALMAIDGQVG